MLKISTLTLNYPEMENFPPQLLYLWIKFSDKLKFTEGVIAFVPPHHKAIGWQSVM